MKTLSHVNTLHELLRIAIDDTRKVHHSGRAELEMSQWVTHDSQGVCFVCMAGSVMLGTLDFGELAERYFVLSPSVMCLDGEIDADTRNKLFAINHLRVGRIGLALNSLGIYADDDSASRIKHETASEIMLEIRGKRASGLNPVPAAIHSFVDPEESFAAMEMLYEKLVAAGL